MRRIALALALAAFILNPTGACAPGDEEPAFQYGATEMRAMVEGTWELALRNGDGSSSKVTVTLAQGSGKPSASRGKASGLIRSAMACESRSLVNIAQACIDESIMPLDVSLVAADNHYTTLKGLFIISSLKLAPGRLSIHLDGLTVNGVVATDGQVSMLGAYGADGVTLTSMVRIAK